MDIITIESHSSSAVTKVVFEAQRYGVEYGNLTVTYTNGLTYRYSNVDVEVITQMLVEGSIGRVMNECVKPIYECEKLSEVA